MYPLKGSPRSGGIFIEGLSGFDKGSRGELGEHGQMTRRSTNHGLQGDYKEEHIYQESKHIQDPIRLLLDTVPQRLRWCPAAHQTGTDCSLLESVRSPQICSPAEAALPVTIDFEAHFCKTICVWCGQTEMSAFSCQPDLGPGWRRRCQWLWRKSRRLLTKAELWDCLAYDYSYGIFVEIFSLQVLELGLAASVFTLYAKHRMKSSPATQTHILYHILYVCFTAAGNCGWCQ